MQLVLTWRYRILFADCVSVVPGPAGVLAIYGNRFRMGVRRGFGVLKELIFSSRL